jgi:hypothetical protein
MNLESLMLAFGVGWAVWVLMRIHRKRKALQQARKDGTAPAPAATTAAAAAREQASMPRVGEPGTLTFNQIKTLQRNGFTPDKQWSREEAALILDAVAYLRIVCRDVAADDDDLPPLEIQNELLRYILTQQDLRDYVRKWGEDMREAGREPIEEADRDVTPELARNNQFDRIAAKAREFLEA